MIRENFCLNKDDILSRRQCSPESGMLELPYLSEERLEKLGVPLGPRIRQDSNKSFE